MTMRLAVGDIVRPKPEWVGSPCNIPTGRVRAVLSFGTHGAVYVEGHQRAVAGYVFDKVEIVQCEFCGQRITRIAGG